MSLFNIVILIIIIIDYLKRNSGAMAVVQKNIQDHTAVCAVKWEENENPHPRQQSHC
jgi:hypothetical protein